MSIHYILKVGKTLLLEMCVSVTYVHDVSTCENIYFCSYQIVIKDMLLTGSWSKCKNYCLNGATEVEIR